MSEVDYQNKVEPKRF